MTPERAENRSPARRDPFVQGALINVLKTPGMSSHAVVARLRRLLGVRQIGHGGTLDPGAAGTLPILVGRATKLMPYLVEREKSYRAEMTLGITTDSQDASGRTVRVASDFSLPPTALGDAMATFLGDIEQVPPMVSALKIQGQRLYELARAGDEVERAARPIRIHALHIKAIFPSDAERLRFGTRVLFDVTCSKGTYVRTLCHDIGERLGCGAHMSFLVRTAVGPYRLEDSFTLQELQTLAERGALSEAMLPMESALVHLPRLVASKAIADKLRMGQAQPVAAFAGSSRGAAASIVRVVEDGADLVCVGRVDDDGRFVHPVRVVG